VEGTKGRPNTLHRHHLPTSRQRLQPETLGNARLSRQHHRLHGGGAFDQEAMEDSNLGHGPVSPYAVVEGPSRARARAKARAVDQGAGRVTWSRRVDELAKDPARRGRSRSTSRAVMAEDYVAWPSGDKLTAILAYLAISLNAPVGEADL